LPLAQGHISAGTHCAGIYQIITRRGRRADVIVYPHRFRHHFSRTWLDRGGPEGSPSVRSQNSQFWRRIAVVIRDRISLSAER
jgi:integrase